MSREIALAKAQGGQRSGGSALVVGASSGYGLASRITAAFSHGMNTLGIAFEKEPRGARTGTAGWYNMAAFRQQAEAEGLRADNVNADAFSRETLEDAIARIRKDFGKLNLFVYSVAAPRRTDPATGEEYRSALKTTASVYETRFLDVSKGTLSPASFEPATEEEIRGTVKVMGGEDLERWVNALLEADLLAPGCRVIAFSYIGPEVTHPVYREGTIGHAKKHLEDTARRLHRLLSERIGGLCHTVVAKSLVTQSSSAIPAISLYMSLAFKVMKDRGVHEDAIQQILRLFRDHLAPDRTPTTDSAGRIRIDDWEMDPAIQTEIMRLWGIANDENVGELADVAGYNADFLRLFGFGVEGVDYSQAVETEVTL